MRPTVVSSAAAGVVADDPGGFAMSSQLRDLSTAGGEQDTAGRHENAAAAAHPRGMGFRVLSRMARGQSDDDAEYLPRHRLDGSDADADAEAETDAPSHTL
jgi:hypothetical protein